MHLPYVYIYIYINVCVCLYLQLYVYINILYYIMQIFNIYIYIYICKNVCLYIILCESVWHVYARPARGSLEHSNKFASFGKPLGDIAAPFLAIFRGIVTLKGCQQAWKGILHIILT